MSITHIEIYMIDETKYAIEDYEDGRSAKEHFFADKYPSECKRFRCWRRGGGIGQADTITEARVIIRDYALQHANKKHDAALITANICDTIIGTLGNDDIFNLARFLQTEDSR